MEQMESSPFDGFCRKRGYLICIDSDGCAMDTMDVKHQKCFGPLMVEEWELEDWADEILFYWNKVNLYSMTRGINRFKALATVLSWVNGRYKEIPDVESLARWTGEDDELSNDALRKQVSAEGSICLEKALHWSELVNE